MTNLHTFTAVCDRLIAPDTSSGDAPDWVHLFPLGAMDGRDGRKFTLNDPQSLVATFLKNGVDLPIDYEHQSDKPSSGPVPAAGWIKELQVRQDGLWGRVEWTATASEMICKKEYRYISPSFLHLTSGEVVRVKGAGLVHKPNLHLTALASEETDMTDNPQDGTAIMRKLAALLKLPETASSDDILAAFKEALNAKSDPSKFVPIEAVAKMMRDRNTTSATMAEMVADQKVSDALRAGFITPAMKDWATALCAQDPTSFDSFIDSAGPAYGHLFKPSVFAGRRPPSSEVTITEGDTQAAICAQLCLPAGTLNS